jgi:replicative DNA helicase
MIQQIITSAELKKRWLEYQRERHNHPELYGLISTGLIDVDAILGGGYEKGQYVLVGGPQKSGKSTLLLCMAKACAEQGKNIIWFGGEMNNMQIGTMIFSNISGISRTKIRAIGLELGDWDTLERAGQDLENLPIYWNYGFTTVEDINGGIELIESAHNITLDAIFVDYIQLMESSGVGRPEQLQKINRGLKRMTMRPSKPLAVVAAAQINRTSIRGNIIDANSFMGSASFEQDMDIGMIITNKEDDITDSESKNIKTITVVGSRETDVGDTQVIHNGKIAFIGNAAIKDDFRGQVYWT